MPPTPPSFEACLAARQKLAELLGLPAWLRAIHVGVGEDAYLIVHVQEDSGLVRASVPSVFNGIRIHLTQECSVMTQPQANQKVCLNCGSPCSGGTLCPSCQAAASKNSRGITWAPKPSK